DTREGDRGAAGNNAVRSGLQPGALPDVHSRPGLPAGEARRGSGGGISEDGRSSRDRADKSQPFAGQAGSGPGVCNDWRHGKGQSRISGFLRAVEGCGPRCPDPEGSEGGVRAPALDNLTPRATAKRRSPAPSTSGSAKIAAGPGKPADFILYEEFSSWK